MSCRSAVVAAVVVGGLTAAPAQATPPGRNGQLAWMRQIDRRPPDLWIANPDGTGQREVLSARSNVEAEPAWSPVAPTSLAFIRETPSQRQEVWVGDIATGAIRRVTRHRTFTFAPSFSPDRRRIVYETDRDFPAAKSENEPPSPPEIYVANTDGTGRRRHQRDAVLERSTAVQRARLGEDDLRSVRRERGRPRRAGRG
jgi:WD40-like Beta Propeller Repeat